MKKRFDKEDSLVLLIVAGAIMLICGWITIFAILPILGICEAIKMILSLPYDKLFIVVGNIGALGGIIIASFIIYESLILKLEKRISRKKLKKVKEFICIIILAVVIATICLLVMQTNIMVFLSQSIMFLFGIEIILFAILLMLFTNKYVNSKINKESRG